MKGTVKKLSIGSEKYNLYKGKSSVVQSPTTWIEIYRGINMETADTFLIWRWKLRKVTRERLEKLENNLEHMKLLEHKNIVRLVGKKKTSKSLYVVTEMCSHGSVLNNKVRYRGKGKMKEFRVVQIIRQVLLGLAYIHKNGIIHGEIKGSNILLDLCYSGSVVKIPLLGFGSFQFTVGPSYAPYWTSPELQMLQKPTTKADIWSLGCLVIELMTGKPPFYHLQQFAAMYKICHIENPEKMLVARDIVSEECRDFLLLCFQLDVTKRPSASELIRHRWISQAFNDEKERIMYLRSSSDCISMIDSFEISGLSNCESLKAFKIFW